MYEIGAEAMKLCYMTLVGCGVMTVVQAISDKNKLATSRFGSKKNMKNICGKDGFILSKNYQLSFKKTLEGTLILAPTGTNKTTSTIVPNLLSNHFPKCSKVIADPKGELYELTANYQRSIGVEPILFTPLEENACYNLLTGCKDISEVKELAQSILTNGDLSYSIRTGSKSGGSEWLNMAQPLLNAVFIYMYEKNGTVFEAVKMLLDKGIKELHAILSSSTEEVKENWNMFLSCIESPKTYSSILITLNSAIQIFLDRKLQYSLSKTDFTAKNLRERPIALYISYPERKSTYLAPFLATFYTQFINNLMDLEGLPILFMLDEFGTIGNIADISNTMATCRSREIGFICAIQSLTQLYQTYGKYNAINILNNLKTKIILPCLSDIDALRYISDLCGTREVEKDNRTQKKTLLEYDEVRRLKDDEVLIIAHNKLPVKDFKNIYFEQEKYLKNVIS